MKDLVVAVLILIAAFVTLGMRATHAPYDFRSELARDAKGDDSLNSALTKAFEKSKSQRTPHQ